jgi:hypothetical protein
MGKCPHAAPMPASLMNSMHMASINMDPPKTSTRLELNIIIYGYNRVKNIAGVFNTV